MENSAEKEITARRDKVVAERARVLEERAALAARLRQLDQELSDLKAAARVFNLAIDFPEEPSAFKSWVHLKHLRLPTLIPPSTSDATDFAIEGPSNAAVESTSNPVTTAAPAISQPAVGVRPSVREIALNALLDVVPQGLTAAHIREQLERKYGLVVHDKTVGMTLYRLSKDGMVHRDRHTWFFGPPSAETKNPGGGTPGSDVFG